tara:strand:- start:477 stop:752 length:276 start_codon:yes stop_codon:yes gene_type:complete
MRPARGCRALLIVRVTGEYPGTVMLKGDPVSTGSGVAIMQFRVLGSSGPRRRRGVLKVPLLRVTTGRAQPRWCHAKRSLDGARRLLTAGGM